MFMDSRGCSEDWDKEKKKFPHGRDKDGEQILDKQLIPK
jgi:hypothetical protein